MQVVDWGARYIQRVRSVEGARRHYCSAFTDQSPAQAAVVGQGVKINPRIACQSESIQILLRGRLERT